MCHIDVLGEGALSIINFSGLEKHDMAASASYLALILCACLSSGNQLEAVRYVLPLNDRSAF